VKERITNADHCTWNMLETHCNQAVYRGQWQRYIVATSQLPLKLYT
jgi:hypothetical protein